MSRPDRSPNTGARRRELEQAIAGCMLRDQTRFRRSLGRIRRGKTGGLVKLAADVEISRAERERRAQSQPAIHFPEELPIVLKRAEIADAIREHPVVVVCGETGSGKSTQLPKICLDMGRGVGGQIGHTQPRRIAARSIANRIAEELGTAPGTAVGHTVRFGDHTPRDAFIKVMTDGILLAEVASDRALMAYDTIIIDEAHERSLNIDFLLGYLKRLIPRRPDLKIIVTSATIDPERFSAHFDGAPIIEVSGRTYPVDVRYHPLSGEDVDERDRDLLPAILEAVDELAALRAGDVLVFLSGEREIRETAEALRKHHPPETEILPLYARLSVDEQQRVFAPHAGRRIVLATNVAETSLTVPGIFAVVDPGFARLSRYRARARVQQLLVEPISQASARQRAGRCGRLGPGVCVRLYSESDFDEREAFTLPELLRSNLASVILRMRALGIGDVRDFPFLETPGRSAIKDGFETLHELGALDEEDRLTELGRELARLPIDPRIGRMILAARDEECLTEVLIIAAALAVQDPRERPMDQRGVADEAHKQFADESSDFLAFLNLWTFFHERKQHLSWNKLRACCREHHVSFVRMREWIDVHRQLKRMVTEGGAKVNTVAATAESIHRALLAGLLRNIGQRDEHGAFKGATSTTFHVFPGSTLFSKPPRWVMSADIVETSRRYARCVARIQPGWIERVGEHLLKRAYGDPFWDKRSAQAMVHEQVMIYGLEIVPRRRVPLTVVDSAGARAMFIQHGLVDGEYESRAPFFAHNRELIESVREVEAKRRRRDVLVDPRRLESFYDQRLPASVTNGRRFENWRRRAERDDPRRLFMAESDVVEPGAGGASGEDFPATLLVGETALPLTYAHEPGADNDGVTLTAPVAALPSLLEERLDWLVPGLLQEKIVAMIRALPKDERRIFVPAPDRARACVELIEFGRGGVGAAVSRALAQQTGIDLPPDAWRLAELPDHLRMRVRVVDVDGKELASGRDLAGLRQRLRLVAADVIADAQDTAFTDRVVTDWDFGPLEERVEVTAGGMRVPAYPALVDGDGAVRLTLMPTALAAQAATQRGLRRLFLNQCREELAFQLEYLPDREALQLAHAPFGSSAMLDEGLLLAICDRAFMVGPPVRDDATFRARLDQGWTRLGECALHVADEVLTVFREYGRAYLAVDRADKPVWRDVIDAVRADLARLMPADVITTTPPDRFPSLARALAAVVKRLEKLPGGGHLRDARHRETLAPLWADYHDRRAALAAAGIEDHELEVYRWMLEEYAVMLFAQELGKVEPVSMKRLSAQWARIRSVDASHHRQQ